MDRIIQMVIRMVIRQFVSKGINAAMKAGGDAMGRRKAGKAGRGTGGDFIDQDAAITQRRKRHPDERRGDEILYPTDGTTDDMQPRK